jgi:hypothetical protein
MKPSEIGSWSRAALAMSSGRGLTASRPSVDASARSHVGTGSWQRKLCVMSG